MRTLFIINPTAGAHRTRTRWAALEKRLSQIGLHAEHRFTSRRGEAIQLARDAAGNYEVVVGVGGDGTISEVADGLLSAKANSTALAVVPFGTGNDYAAALGVRTETDAINSLISGRTRQVDIIQAHCMAGQTRVVRHALLFAGVGIICETLRRTTGVVKRLFGQRLSYPVGLAWALCTYRSPHMRIHCDAAMYEAQFLFVGASNTELAGGGMRLAPGARIDDGELNLNLVHALGRWQAFKQLRRVCQGRHTSHPAVTYLPIRNVEVAADVPLEVAADGDLIGHTPARFEICASMLRVRVPFG